MPVRRTVPRARRSQRVQLTNMTHEARELYLFTINEPSLYERMVVPIRANLDKKRRKGTYSRPLAVKAWTHLATAAAKEYSRQHSTGKDWSRMFPPAVRRAVAEELERDYYDEAQTRARNPGTRFYAASTAPTRMENPSRGIGPEIGRAHV